MKYRYYVTNLEDGSVVGTEDKKIAEEFATSDYYIVVDSELGLWLQVEAEVVPIETVVKP